MNHRPGTFSKEQYQTVYYRLKEKLMESTNPVFKRGYAAMPGSYASSGSTQSASQVVIDHDELESAYQAPAASAIRTGRMTMDDVVIRTGMLFAVLLAAGAWAWRANYGSSVLIPALLIALVMGMVNSFSSKVRPALALAYAAFEGLALGIISHVYNEIYQGIVAQAIIGTIAAFSGVLFMYKSGRIRVTPRFTRVLTGAVIGYMLLGLASMFMGMAGVGRGYGLYGVSGLGLLLCVGGVALASFFLILDFDQIQKMINSGAPHQESWRAGFGLMVTIVWLYMEILRLLAILREK